MNRDYKSAEVIAIEKAHRETRWWLLLILAVIVFGFLCRRHFEKEVGERMLWRFPTKAETGRTVPK